MYSWDWSWVWTFRRALLEAIWVTIWLNLVVLLLGSSAGLVVSFLRRSKYVFFRFLSIVYVDIFRTLPVLVLLVWFFFCVPILLGGLQLSPMLCAIVVLSLNLSAFVAEIIRAGIEGVPKAQIESAQACGLSDHQTFFLVTLPIAIRVMIPPLVGQYINTVKLSVLASVIAVPELLHKTTDIISQVYRPLEFYSVLALIFLVLLLPGTIWSRRMEGESYLHRLEEKI